MKREEIVAFISDQSPEEVVLFDGIEDAFVGVAERFGMGPVAAYDYDKCIQIYMEDGMTLEGAVEYFGFNTIGLWAGDKTPIFVRFA